MTYVMYNYPEEVAALDKNVWHARLKTLISDGKPVRLYDDVARPPTPYACDYCRDPETHYILGLDRDDHPDHSSRFGRGTCPNGYCSGHWPGRYIEDSRCANNDPQPPNMAPARFYEPQNLGAFVDSSWASARRESALKHNTYE